MRAEVLGLKVSGPHLKPKILNLEPQTETLDSMAGHQPELS